MKIKHLILSLIFILSLFTVKTQGIVLDESFGQNGLAQFPGFSLTIGYNIQNFEDGSYALLSIESSFVTGDEYYSISKIQDSGEKDPSFAANGQFDFSLNSGDYPADMIITEEEKIMVTSFNPINTLNIITLNDDGNIFREDRFSFRDSLVPQNEYYALRIREKGDDIYIGGVFYQEYNQISNYTKSFVLKSNKNGQIDSTFAENGLLLIDEEDTDIEFFDFEINGDEIILMYLSYGEMTEEAVYLDKYNMAGEKVSTFGEGGTVLLAGVEAYSGNLYLYNDKIITLFPEYAIAFRLDQNGELDSSYGNSGIAWIDIGDEDMGGMFSNMNAEGKIYFTLSNTEFDPDIAKSAIVGFDENGQPDKLLGESGFYETELPGGEILLNVQFDNENRILTTGIISSQSLFLSFLARYIEDTSPVEEVQQSGDKYQVLENPSRGDRIQLLTILDVNKWVNIDIYNLAGQKISELYQGKLNAGSNKISLTSNVDLFPGIYVLKIESSGSIISKKIMIK